MASLLSTSTPEDSTDHSLPSFTTFIASDLDPSWDYYDRSSSDRNTIISADVITSQANSNYTRPWEMESKDAVKGFEPFPKLPSFQSQFHVYNDAPLVPEPSLPQPVPVPISPSTITSPLNGSLTQLTPIHSLTPLPPHSTGPSFHTLTTVQATPPPRSYPLVPAPIQARDIPTIQQQYLDERHIQLYQPISTFSPAQNVVTVVHQKGDLHNGMHHHPSHHHQHHHQNAFQPAPIQAPAPITMMETNMNGNGTPMGFNGTSKAAKESTGSPMRSAENRKKERRKIRASSIESSADSDGSAMDLGDMSSGQVSAVSSTANFKSPMGNALGHNDGQDSESTGEKGLKQKKRKRCGECNGCQRKDNCGDCAPCRNDKSHQICKQRRCEKLTDKKLIYGADGTLIRGESKRGRGKGRGSGTTRTSFRGRKSLKFAASAASPRSQAPAASASPQPASVPQQSPNTNTSASTNVNGTTTTVTIAGTNGTTNGSPMKSNGQVLNGQMQQQQPQQHTVHHQHQPQHIQATTTIHAIKDDGQQQHQPMAPMAFYPTWQAATDPSQGWTNQFIQQIPQNTTATATIAPLNTIEFQPQSYAYPANGYVQTGIGFDPNYGRTYAAPTIQRYEFQASNQINQVALQNVSFAPTTVTYAGQVATGPSPILLANGQQSISMAGNDQPGYPRVSSVPPPSLSYNGYTGEVSGKPISNNNNNSSSTPERNTVTPNSHMSAMNPPPAPQLTQSPSRQQEQQPSNAPANTNSSSSQFSPNHQMQHHSPHPYGGQPQQPSPNPHLNSVANYAVATPSPSGGEWDWSNGGGNSGDMYNQQSNGAGGDRLNLNTRLKTMILSKSEGGHNQSQGSQHHMSSVELSPPPSNGSAHGNGSGQSAGGHFAIIKNVC